MPPHGHEWLSSGAKLSTTQTLLLACRVAELGPRWCEVSQEETAQARSETWERGLGLHQKDYFFNT